MADAQEYLEARIAAEGAFEGFAAVRDLLDRVSQAFSKSPEEAVRALPNEWPSHGEIKTAAEKAVSANTKMQEVWDRLPAQTRKHSASPLGVPGLRIPD